MKLNSSPTRQRGTSVDRESMRRLGTTLVPRLRVGLMYAIALFFAISTAWSDDKPAAKLLPWKSDLETARREALAEKRPIFVRVVGDACPWCRKLDHEIEQTAVQTELRRWTLVVLDVDADAGDARQLHVGPIPALRVLSSQGRLLASHDGFLEAADLVEWLGKQYDAAAESPDDLLLATGEPTLIEVLKVAKLLGHRDATLREAALHRLVPHPKAAGPAMLKTVREGPLAAQLTALDLFAEWKAPVEGLDPWQPNTLSPERLAKLEAWLAEVSPEGLALVRETLTEEERRQAAVEIDRMLKGDDVAAAAAREQLARFGPALLPDVYARLKEVSEDRDRQRLIALRYRLVATPDLPLRWPGGLERLADGDVAVRHKAVDELARLATSEHERLLLELFSDPDPLVREISLRGLKAVSGNRAASALVKLLDDPDPNVRAAVLKQLAEDSPPGMVETISAYIAKETDPDLIVHALRYFGAVKGASITEAVQPLLSHESWQVRAEAAHALSQRAKESRYGEAEEAVAIGKVLVKSLADDDPFVVARALEGLEYAGTSSAVEPLVKAVERNPSLAPAVVKVLIRSEKMREKALPHLRGYLDHQQPGVRAAAIAGLAELDSETIADELKKAISDAERPVRVAAATTLLDVLEKLRLNDADQLTAIYETREETPQADPTDSILGALSRLITGKPASAKPQVKPADPEPSPDTTKKPDGEDPEQDSDNPDRLPAQGFGHKFDVWLAELYQGQHRKKWTADFVEPLEKLAQSDDAEERIVALVALIPLGKGNLSAPRLLEEARSTSSNVKLIGRALGWLTWPPREILARELATQTSTEDALAQLAAALVHVPDVRSTPLLWELLDRKDVTVGGAESLQQSLTMAYFGQRYYDPERISARIKREASQALVQEAKEGRVLKRLVALNLLMQFSPEESAPLAKALLDDEAARAELGPGAFQVYLAALGEKERAEEAVAAMQGEDRDRRRIAIKYLAVGADVLDDLANGFSLHVVEKNERSTYSSSSNKAIVPEPPKHVTLEQVRPLIADADPQVAAYAGYVLALLGEPEGLEPLLKYWRERSLKKPDAATDRLVYRAIAAVDEGEHIGVLQQIAQRLDEHAASEFYWTIRIMTGPEILKFRKEVREKFGMETLR
jgi:HEAT repeat protein